MAKKLLISLVVIALLALGGTTAWATHEFVIEEHPYSEVVTIGHGSKQQLFTVQGTITDTDPLPHPVTVTVTAPTTTSSPPPPPPPSSANVYISTSGSDANPCTQAAPCRTFNRGYRAAPCGGVVEIAAGSYGGQSVIRDAAKDSCIQHTTLRPAVGASVTFGGEFGTQGVPANAPHHLIVEGLASPGGWSIRDGANNLIFRRMDGGMIYMSNPHHVLIEDSDFGPCESLSSQTAACRWNVKIDGAQSDNITFRRNTFHDFVIVPGSGDHFECFFLRGGTNILMEQNKFWNCHLYDIFLQPCCGATANVVIQNNWFGHASTNALVLGANSGGLNDVLIRHNSFTDGEGVIYEGGTQSNVRVVGNIIGVSGSISGGCNVSGVTYSYNVYKSGGCGVGSANLGGAVPPYVNGSAFGSMDYHLSGNSVADNLVPANCPSSDYDSQARIVPCDAGSDER